MRVDRCDRCASIDGRDRSRSTRGLGARETNRRDGSAEDDATTTGAAMRYVSVRTEDVRRDAMRHLGARAVERATETLTNDAQRRVSDGLTTTSEEGWDVGESEEDSVTFDDGMTGGRRRSEDGGMTARDIIEAVPVVRCEETMGWTEEARARRDAGDAAYGTVKPMKIRVEDDGGARVRLMEIETSNVQKPRMRAMEVPVIEDEDETRTRIRSAIRQASFETASETIFDLDEDALNALDCVENDLQKRYDVERSDEVPRETPSEKMKDFLSLFPRLRETAFALDGMSLLETPLAFAMSLAKKVETLPWEGELKVDSSWKDYLKKLLLGGPKALPSIDPLEEAMRTATINPPPVRDVNAPTLMEVVNPCIVETDVKSVLKSMTKPVNVEAPINQDFALRAKENLTKKLLEVPSKKFVLDQMPVPKTDEEDDTTFRAERAIRDVIKSVEEVKERAPALSNWKVPFPSLMESLEKSRTQEDLPAMLDEVIFEDENGDWTWDDIPQPHSSANEPVKTTKASDPRLPTLSESISLPNANHASNTCLIDVVEITLDSYQVDLIQVLAQRYAYTKQILPLDVQAMIPTFQLGQSSKISQFMMQFAHEPPAITRHLKSLLCCQIAANLVQVYGVHMAHTFMRNEAKDDQDLGDIKNLIERQDVSVSRGEFDDHPKLRALKTYLARLIVNGGKMLVIFPDTLSILAVRQFISRMNMRVRQFDGRQEFTSLQDEDIEEFSRAARISATETDVLIALEAHVNHEAFPLELFSTCVYYAPSAEALELIRTVGASRYAANRSVHALTVKQDSRWLNEGLEPASSALNHSRERVKSARDTSAVYDEEPNLSPPREFNGVPRHMVVLNVARQIVGARDHLFAEVERILIDHGCEVVLRPFAIDVDACCTIGNQVHAVILIVPEYFVEGLPTQLELFSLTEDLVVALSDSFLSGTIIFEGGLEFLRIAQSLCRRVCSDALRLNISIDCRFCVEEEVLPTVIDVLCPQNTDLSEFTAPVPVEPSTEELELCEMLPLLNPISACTLLADDIVRSGLQTSGGFTPKVMAHLEGQGNIGCPLSVLMNGRRIIQPTEIASPVFSPQTHARPRGLNEGHASRPITDFLSPIKRQRLDDSMEFGSSSLDSLYMTPSRRPSMVQHKIHIPSPAMDLRISPTAPPRSLMSPERPFSRVNPSKIDIGGQLWVPMRNSGGGPSNSTATRTGRGQLSMNEFPEMLESYRMPPPPDQRHASTFEHRVSTYDPERNLTQHRFRKISSAKQRFPKKWM